MPLHRLEPGQIFHFVVSLFVIGPDIEGALQEQFTQLSHISLEEERNGTGEITRIKQGFNSSLSLHPHLNYLSLNTISYSVSRWIVVQEVLVLQP